MIVRDRQTKLEARRDLLAGFEVRDKAVLDAGTGVGVALRAIAELQPASIVSVSIDASELDRVRASLPDHLRGVVELRQADLRDLSALQPGFDLCVADYLFTAIDALTPGGHEAVFAEIRRVLRPGGAVVVVDAEPTTQPQPLDALHALWSDVGAALGWTPYGSYEPEEVIAALRSCGFDAQRGPDAGREERGEAFVRANADGIARAIGRVPVERRGAYEARRERVVRELFDALPLMGPRRFSLVGTLACGARHGRGRIRKNQGSCWQMRSET